MIEKLDDLPWYKQFWPWFIISIPAATVVACMFTIYLAIDSFDGMVVDDYYQHGMAINKQIQRDSYALNHHMDAKLHINNREKTIRLTMQSDIALPKQVNLHLRYATRAGFDQVISLAATPQALLYTGILQHPLKEGKWLVQVETDEWRIQAIFLAIELNKPIALTPAQ